MTPRDPTPDRKRLELLVQATGLGIWLNPLPLGELVWNDNVKAHFHLPPDARVDIDTFYARLHPDDRARVQQAVETAIAEGSTMDVTYRTVGFGGAMKWIRAVGRAVFDAQGVPIQFDGITVDISDQLEAQNRLREFADTAPTMLWVTEPNGRCSFLSKGWSAYTGQPESQGLGFGWLQMVHEDDRAAASDAFLAANATCSPFAIEHRLHHGTGGWRWVIDAGSPRFARNGEFLGYVGAVTDIHERRTAEMRLRESDERYRAFVANSSEGIWRMEFDPPVDTALSVDEQVDRVFRDGRFAECNAAFARMYGFDSPSDLVGRGLSLMMDPARPEVREYLAGLVTAGYRADEAESSEHDQHGQPLWFSNSLSGVLEDGLLVRAWGTQRDITDRKRAEMALQDADRRKDEFLATLAHELRNPLAPIRNAVQVLNLRAPADPLVQRYHAMIDRQVGHLARLIEDLMDVSRIARNRLELRRGPVVAQDVVRAALDNSRAEVEGGDHPIELQLPQEPLVLDGDEVRLVQIVMNLVTNAAKYSEAGTPIAVALAHEGEWATLRVRDRGQGIAAADLDRIFELFYQGESGSRRRHGGLGIGLSLVKRLAELHGGQVEARSEGPGRGSEFVVRLPAARAQAGGAGRVEDAEASGRTLQRILVVDDNVDSAETLAELLRLVGHEVRTAHDGRGALQAAAAMRPDVVLMDLGMPGMDGYDTCRALRGEPWGPAVRVIALSGWGQPGDQERSRAAGFDAHLVKPVRQEDLERLLEPDGIAGREGTASS